MKPLLAALHDMRIPYNVDRLKRRDGNSAITETLIVVSVPACSACPKGAAFEFDEHSYLG